MEEVKNKVIETLLKEYRFIKIDVSNIKEIIFSNVDLSGSLKQVEEACKTNLDEYLKKEIESGGLLELLENAIEILGDKKAFSQINRYIVNYDIIVPYEDSIYIAQKPEYEDYIKYLLYNYKNDIENYVAPFTENSLLSQVIEMYQSERGVGFTNDQVRDYLISIGKYRLLSKEETDELFKKYKYGDKEAKDKLIIHNLKLVVAIARRFCKRDMSMQFMDLIQEGNKGLIKAVEKYDVEKGFRFSTSATWWIFQAIQRSVCDYERIIRIPVHICTIMSKYNRYMESFRLANGRYPTEDEVKEFLNLSPTRYETFQDALKIGTTTSLDKAIAPDDGKSSDPEAALGNFIKNNEDEETPEDYGIRMYVRKEQEDAFHSVLTKREEQVLRFRIGYDDGKERTLEEIGKIFKVTRERIRQIEAKAIKKLKAYYGEKEIMRAITKDAHKAKSKGPVYELSKTIDPTKYEVLDYTGDYSYVKVKCLSCNTITWLNEEDLNKSELCPFCSGRIKKLNSNDKEKKVVSKMKIELCEYLEVDQFVLNLFIKVLEKEDQELFIKDEKNFKLSASEKRRYYYLRSVLKNYISYFKVRGKVRVYKKVLEEIYNIPSDKVLEIMKEKFSKEEHEAAYKPGLITNEEQIRDYIKIVKKFGRELNRENSEAKEASVKPKVDEKIKKEIIKKQGPKENQENKKTKEVKRKKSIAQLIGIEIDNRILDALIKRLPEDEQGVIEKRKVSSLSKQDTLILNSAIYKLTARIKVVKKDMVYDKNLSVLTLVDSLGGDYDRIVSSLWDSELEILSAHLQHNLKEEEINEFLTIIEVIKIKLGVYDELPMNKKRKTIYEIIGADKETVDKLIEALPEDEKELIQKKISYQLNREETERFRGIKSKLKYRLARLSVEDTDQNLGEKTVSNKQIDTLYDEGETNEEDVIVESNKAAYPPIITTSHEMTCESYKEDFYKGYFEKLALAIEMPEILYSIGQFELNITRARIGIGEGFKAHLASEVAVFFGISEEDVERISKETVLKLDNYMTEIMKKEYEKQRTRITKPVDKE